MASVRNDVIRMVGDLIVAYTNVDRRLIKAQSLLQEGMSANANLEIGSMRAEFADIGQRFKALLEYVDANLPPELKPLDE